MEGKEKENTVLKIKGHAQQTLWKDSVCVFFEKVCGEAKTDLLSRFHLSRKKQRHTHRHLSRSSPNLSPLSLPPASTVHRTLMYCLHPVYAFARRLLFSFSIGLRQYRGACPASKSDAELLELVKKMGGDEAKIQSALEDWWQSESKAAASLCMSCACARLTIFVGLEVMGVRSSSGRASSMRVGFELRVIPLCIFRVHSFSRQLLFSAHRLGEVFEYGPCVCMIGPSGGCGTWLPIGVV